MNPFTIGDTLTVQFGNRQPFTVAALTAERCAMRFPNTHAPAVLWYSVADLLRWNPQPCRAIVPVQFPAIVPGLRIQRPEVVKWGDTCIVPAQDYTVVAVLRGVAFVCHHTPELAGSITDCPLATFWQTSHPAPAQISHTPAPQLDGHDLRTIATIWRARCKGQNYWMNRFNDGLDKLDQRTYERLTIEREYRRTRQKLTYALKAVS